MAISVARARISGLAGTRRRFVMSDVIMLGLGLSFFGLAIGYAYACERL